MIKKIKWSLFALLMIFATAACTPDLPDTGTSGTGAKDQPEKIVVMLFYPTKDALNLETETQEIVKEEKWLEKALLLLQKQPKNANLVPAIPEGDWLRSIKIDGKVAKVDMKGETIKKWPQGTTTEQIIIESIANTLVKTANVEKVIFLIDGKSAETLLGHVDLLDPISPDPQWLKK